MATGTRHVVIVQGHPDPQHRHFCHALADAYAAGARGAGHEVVTVDVARLDFPLARSREDLESEPTPEAIRQVQEALTRADHVVLFYPGLEWCHAGSAERVSRTDLPVVLRLPRCQAR